MASIKTRDKKDGTTSYIVLWRAGGARNAKQESEIFSDPDRAERFKNLVNGHGQQWPPGWVRGKGFVAERRPETKFETFAIAYVDRLTGVQGDTRSKYKKDILRNMVPWFGPYSVEDGEGGIVRTMVQDWVNDLQAGRPAPLDPPGSKPRTAYKPKTIQDKHGLLFAILQSAVDAEPPLRATNPCAKSSLPRLDADEDEDEMVFLEREEFGWIHQCIADDARDLLEGFGETGGRWGEVTALQPRDLQRRNGRPAIRIQRAWKRDEGGKRYLGPPKTKKSRRTIVVTERYWQKLTRLAQGKAPNDLLFTGPEGGAWDAGTFRRLRWMPAIELAAEKFGLIKRPRIHDIRHSHVAWLIARKLPLPAIQGRLGHESITTTVDRYGHLLDALDDEVMDAVAWAMDPTAPLPTFLAYSGLVDATAGLPPVPQQRSGFMANAWVDASEPESSQQHQGPVFVVTFGGQEVPFTERELAQEAADQWADDHANVIEAMRSEGWAEEKIRQRGALGPEERPEWTGGGAIWTRMPERQFVHYATASHGADPQPFLLTSRWTWEFETNRFTTKSAEYRTEHRPHGTTEAHARGISKTAVKKAFEKASEEAVRFCSENPHLSPAGHST